MRVEVFTREFPPEIYGGAGVHVDELVRALRNGAPSGFEVGVRCFGAERHAEDVRAYAAPAELSQSNPALRTLGVDLLMAQDAGGADLVHSHTWYANGAGHLAKLLHGVPHVMTAHSLEPLRPWKAEQLGGGYRVSSWIERAAIESADAVIAVSHGMRRDLLGSYPAIAEDRVHVVHNGIDTDRWRPVDDPDLVRSLGVDPQRPSVVFVGRITRQKGLPHLLRAARNLPADVQLVLCAGAPDTPELLEEVKREVQELEASRGGVVWHERLLAQRELAALLTAATVFVCPSLYEPLGIVNLEAMACGAAVVATATGGIPEVVDDGVTGRLVPVEQLDDGTGTPLDPERFERDLADALNEVVDDPEAAARMGRAGRARAEAEFGWDRIADRTLGVYRSLMGGTD
ncbi:glycogen synthase [Ruicaihuangia caeni]|uniref:D-inositol 3-phosphate glycosyltransferase n=1 Tax=Ruicaihuangia caeni TaxID=3042517 RepID=A0AAW6T4B7_9MICO|nr:glycogen synthase [Klugiella sp. YN-L-19]MDI2098154.1 glycogen synthase [Klugiella sp. YN-L-19]